MITRNIESFFSFARTLTPDQPATARAAFLVSPVGFHRAEQSAQDNIYMADAGSFDADLALHQHLDLQAQLSRSLPVMSFAGQPSAPDGVFPNNAFGTIEGRLIAGRMRHPVRQQEAARKDIRGLFRDVLSYECVDLSMQAHPCELTGAMVIDRARGLGYIGLSERCDERGAQLMHEAFGLRASLMFDLAPGEYHTNVVFAVLAGRAAVVCPNGFADSDVVDAIADFYGTNTVRCTADEHANFVGNCIALSGDTVWMSARAAHALEPSHKQTLAHAGFNVASVDLSAIEAAGGSLRCCVAEIF